MYDGCNPEVTRLSFTLELLKTKTKTKWTNKSLDEHLKLLHNKCLPAGNLCPTSVEEAKKIVCPFDLPHIRYHTCINDCIIYRREHAEKTSCPVCNASRYKKARKISSQKVVWYLPVTTRLQRYFGNPKEAKLMPCRLPQAHCNPPCRVSYPAIRSAITELKLILGTAFAGCMP